MSRYKLVKSIEHASVGTFSGNTLPETLSRVFMEMAAKPRRRCGEGEPTLIQSSKTQGVKEIKISDGKDIFSSSFDISQFNENFIFSFNGSEVEVANPYALIGDYVDGFSCRDVAVKLSKAALEIRIRWATLKLSSLSARNNYSIPLCEALFKRSMEDGLPWDCSPEDSYLERAIRSWVVIHAPSDLKKSVLEDFDPNEFLGALCNRLSDCLNLHLTDSLERHLDDMGDCSAVDGEETLQITEY